MSQDLNSHSQIPESAAETKASPVAGEVNVDSGAGVHGTPAEVGSAAVPWHLPDIEAAFGTLWAPDAEGYVPTRWELGLAARAWAKVYFEADWMSFVSWCPHNKIRSIADWHLDRIAEKIGAEPVRNIIRGVDDEGQRRVGGIAWRFYQKGDTEGYERVVLKHSTSPSACKAMVAEIQRWVGNRFPELPSDELSVLLFRAADKDALESLPLPTCEHTWRRTSLPVRGRRHGVSFDECDKCGALRPVLYDDRGEELNVEPAEPVASEPTTTTESVEE